MNLSFLKEYKNICAFSHTKPDGDSIGSILALRQMLEQIGVEITCLCDCDIPEKYQFMTGSESFMTHSDKVFDFAIFVDCSDISRVGDMYVDILNAKTMCIDHHRTTKSLCDYSIVNPNSASTCQIVLRLLEENKLELTREIAECLYSGLLTDTGGFSNTNTTANEFLDAAKLATAGVDVNSITRAVFKLTTLENIYFLSDIYKKIKLYNDGTVAVVAITEAELSKHNLSSAASEGVVDKLLSIAGVKVAATVLEFKNRHKVSLRSIKSVDAGAVAEHFGGGGHKNAAGCQLIGDYYEVLEKLLRAINLFSEAY